MFIDLHRFRLEVAASFLQIKGNVLLNIITQAAQKSQLLTAHHIFS